MIKIASWSHWTVDCITTHFSFLLYCIIVGPPCRFQDNYHNCRLRSAPISNREEYWWKMKKKNQLILNAISLLTQQLLWFGKQIQLLRNCWAAKPHACVNDMFMSWLIFLLFIFFRAIFINCNYKNDSRTVRKKRTGVEHWQGADGGRYNCGGGNQYTHEKLPIICLRVRGISLVKFAVNLSYLCHLVPAICVTKINIYYA